MPRVSIVTEIAEQNIQLLQSEIVFVGGFGGVLTEEPVSFINYGEFAGFGILCSDAAGMRA